MEVIAGGVIRAEPTKEPHERGARDPAQRVVGPRWRTILRFGRSPSYPPRPRLQLLPCGEALQRVRIVVPAPGRAAPENEDIAPTFAPASFEFVIDEAGGRRSSRRGRIAGRFNALPSPRLRVQAMQVVEPRECDGVAAPPVSSVLPGGRIGISVSGAETAEYVN